MSDDLTDIFNQEEEILKVAKADKLVTENQLDVNQNVMELHLRQALSKPRNARLYAENRDFVGGFIFKSLAKSGLLVASEKFQFTKVTVDDKNRGHQQPNGPLRLESGFNIIGLIPGRYYNTSLDRILVIGAHWDTYGNSPGFDDNGSGVSAMLEAARVLAAASCYQPQFSVYFVAFDAEESGCRGSQEFIYSHLRPHLEATGGQAQGAFILDTILNYDSRPGSQAFSKVTKMMQKFICRGLDVFFVYSDT